MLREILLSPNPILLRKAAEVKDPRAIDPTLIDDMIETMDNANGLGLAAPQVGVELRIFVMNPNLSAETVFINPRIISAKYPIKVEEACLSIPGKSAKKLRYVEIELEAFNRKGVKFRVKMTKLAAVCVQHEMDHLRGRLIA